MINENRIRDRLVKHGEKLFQAPLELVRFTKNETADYLLNDNMVNLKRTGGYKRVEI
jgi:hypothetical protein